MFGARRGQASAALLAGSIVVVLIGIGVLVVAYLERGDKEDALAQSEADLRRARAALQDEISKYRALSKYVGFKGAEELSSVPIMRNFCGERGLYVEGRVKKTLQRYIEELENERNAVRTEAVNLKREAEEHRQKEKETLEELNSFEQQKNAEIEKQHENRKVLDAKLRRTREENRQRIEMIMKSIEAIGAEIYEIEQQWLKEKLELEKEIAELQKRIDTVKMTKELAKERIEEADGRILAVDSEMRYAYIDIGRKDGVTRGGVFLVFDLLKGGKKKEKGEVRVEEVHEHVSKVSIIKEFDPDDPVVKGDLIFSEVFEREKVKVFVFIGRMRGKYTNEEARRKIMEVGWQVADKVTPETSYVVLGEGFEEDENFEEARRLGVHIIREHELIEMLGE